MNKLFISYRRSDSEDATGRIYDRLTSRYGRKNVFKDVDSMPLSVDFREYVKSSILASRVTLVIIGRGWLNAQDEQGQRRLDNPEDFVRVEIETALTAPDMIVIPVLIGRAVMPPKGALPPTLETLIYRNASQVRPDPDFNDDLQELINGLDPYMKKQWGYQLKNVSIKQIIIAGLLLTVAFVAYKIYFTKHIYKSSGDSVAVEIPHKNVDSLKQIDSVYYASKPSLLDKRVLNEVVAIAFSEAGNQESRSRSNSGSEIDKYLEAIGLPSGLGWSQAFIYWCFDQATKKHNVRNPLLRTGSVDAFVARAKLQNVHSISAEDARKDPTRIKPGMVGCLYRMNGGTARFFHAGIVVKVGTATVETVEGNTNSDGGRNGVTVYRKLRNFRKQDMVFVDFGHRNY